MWNNNEEVNDNGEPVKLYLPVQAPPRKTNTAPKDSHIGGHFFLEGTTPVCEGCERSMYLLVQLRLQPGSQPQQMSSDTTKFDRYVSVFACPREECVERLKYNKGFSSGGQGIFKCLEKSVPIAVNESNSSPSALVSPPKSSWYADEDEYNDDDNEWGIDAAGGNDDKDSLEKAVATMEKNLNHAGSLISSTSPLTSTNNSDHDNNKNKSSSRSETTMDGFGCYLLKTVNEPLPKRPVLEEDDVGLSESDEKIRNMLARYMAEEEDEDILAALRGTEMGGGGKGKSAEEDERLSDEDRVLRGFQDRLRRVPQQVLRYAPGGRPLWSVPDKNRKSGKDLWNVPNCECCGVPRRFEFQLLPSILATLEVDKFAEKKTKTVNDNVALDDLLSSGMNFGSVAVFTCPNPLCGGEKEPYLVIQESVDDLPEKGRRNQNDVERDIPSATMAIVEDLDDDDEFEPDA